MRNSPIMTLDITESLNTFDSLIPLSRSYSILIELGITVSFVKKSCTSAIIDPCLERKIFK